MKILVKSLVFFLIIQHSVAGQSLNAADSIHLLNDSTITFGQLMSKQTLIVNINSDIGSASKLWLMKVDSLNLQFKDSFNLLLVPSYEEGFSDSTKLTFLQWLTDSLQLNTLVTQGMYTHNASMLQHQLFKWLSSQQLNGHFDVNTNTFGYKFLVDEQGQLKAVFAPQTNLSLKLCQWIMAIGRDGD